MKIKAYAKINLYLHVLGRRSDDYHDLDSLMTFSDIADELTFSESDAFSLEIDGPFADATPKKDNLVERAALLLADHANRAHHVAIKLTKNISVMGGLGGGSTDAAAALNGLNKFWKLNIKPEALNEIGLQLGSDVPVCLRQQTARVTGRGEHIDYKFALPELTGILINPGIEISTRAAFAALEMSDFSEKANMPDHFKDANEFIGWLFTQRNDLTHPALRFNPDIQACIDAAKKHTGCKLTRMSGSGATCFALFTTADAARPAALLIKAENPTWWVQTSSFKAVN